MWSILIFGPSALEKDTTKLPMAVDQQVCQEANYQLFLKRIHRPFLKFYMELEDLKDQNVIEPIFFCFLKEKFLFWEKCLKSPPKQGFLTFAK